ncbi:hypothetical protein AVL59_22920 [Streptomyces griseochromogenes]|nr:hypothetical protein AVL59_22920 [Streptomyces griseochromogenes]
MVEQGAAGTGEPAGNGGRTNTFMGRLNRLFETVHPSGRGPWSNAEVARSLGLSETYIGYLRKGVRDNPTLAHMQALADFFGVPVAYFVDDEQGEEVRQDLELLSKLKDVGVRQIALRTIADMSESNVESILPVLQRLAETQAENQATPRRRMQPRARKGTSPGAL